MFVVMFLALTGRKRNILLTSNSSDNAERLLRVYRAQLEANKRIAFYYGNQRGTKWTEEHFITARGVSFFAVGARQSPRGFKLDEVRPDVILPDDFDTDEECRNPEIIADKWNWFEQALYFTRSFSEPLLVIWCGNIIARDCCIARAGARARELAGRNKPLGNWDIINIRMVDIRRPDPKRDFAEGVSVWPEKNTEAMIDEVLAQVSAASVQKECFNNPVVEGTYFKEITWGAVPPLNKFPFLISYGDPAPSNRTTHRKGVKALGSFKSNVLLGILDGRLYVITAFLKATSPMMSSSIGTTTKRITSATVRRFTTTSRITSYRIPSTNRFSSRFSCKRPSNGNSSSLSHPTSEPNRINSPELKATSSRSIGRAT